YNSPWNIAAKFNIEMGFSPRQIANMLQEYEADYHYGIDTEMIAEEIYQYTSGYPYLVSAICKLLDEDIVGENARAVWSKEGVTEAVKIILSEKTSLFESMSGQLWNYPEMRNMLYAILFQGKRVTYNSYINVLEQAVMFGYIVNKNNSVQVANRIFEMWMYNMFLSEEELSSTIYDVAQGNRNEFLYNGRLDMDRVLERFTVHFNDIYGANDEKFIEDHGRKLFLLYLKPIINGTGNYYIEAQTRDARRTDVIVDYLGEQFVVELKIWRGNEYNERGEEQLAAYLEAYHLDRGYMISFNFNKNKQPGIKEITLGSRTIVEAVV
ncbi:MAG: 9-O-acetyl-N-acetylneuraminate esterase, partial [Acetatifactor sp.]|nr:9-O-acetyl-N-acetylneuraminate esterase [Acetatifactor sp.]